MSCNIPDIIVPDIDLDVICAYESKKTAKQIGELAGKSVKPLQNDDDASEIEVSCFFVSTTVRRTLDKIL
jgi:hypothetical protein